MSERARSVQRLSDGRYLVSGFAESMSVLSDRRVSNSPFVDDRLHPQAPPDLLSLRRRGTSMQMSDGDVHARLRRVAGTALTPRRCDSALEKLEHNAHGLLDAIVARGSGDLIGDAFAPLVHGVICDLLGVPDGDREQVLRWSEASTMEDRGVSEAGAQSLDDYLESFLAGEPTAGLCGVLAAGAAAGSLSYSEALGTASIMLVAGYETTVSFLGMSTLTLLFAPMLRKVLIEEPELVPTVIEELLRYITPTSGTWMRFVTEDLPLGDAIVPAGSSIDIDLSAANRDPARFENPDLLDPARDDDKHLAFGAGPHYCPGATLARREAQIVLTALLPRLDELTLAVPIGELRWHQNRFSRRPLTLPVVLATASRR
ncbi:cytochrome P450 [Antrihabitans sp. YC2-6]|uniref:cytochrome P450 n=1 Tax=Antrihabitans sp. YC2-6 TaxID=2799498 RepID=UPI0018F74048|nr:cytochrome P450 [Antrihabitans sp. YC2-6]MBJ8348121.1 cytochrome P450 [Antrihabitans sp. YC2-6]